jgi:thioredoxin reductase (NADPH)
VPYQLAGLQGEGARLTGVEVATLDGATRLIAAEVLLPFFGLSMELGPIADWGLALERKHVTVDPATFATSVKAIYAIGDIVTYPGKLKLILTGFAEAAAAAHAIYALLRPDTPLHFEYSTMKGVPVS